MKPPDDNAFKLPLEFAALGIEAEEGEARETLQEDLQAIFDGLSREDLAKSKAYVKLFKPFAKYGRTVFEAFSAKHPADLLASIRFSSALANHIAPSPNSEVPLNESSGVFDPETDLNRRIFTRAQFYRALQDAEPWTKRSHVFRANPDSGDVWEDDEEEEVHPSDFIEPDCLWEEVVSECAEPPTVQKKLPADYLDALVYVMRDASSPAHTELWAELSARSKLLGLAVPPIAKVVQGGGPKNEQKHGPESDAEGFKKTYEITEKKEFAPWTKHLRKVCAALDDAGVKRNKKGGAEVTWSDSYRDRKNWDALERAIRRRRKHHLDALSQTVS
ncbi:MAG: hypothetical protein O2795_17870 [Acidobacteria bacterium]|nr:hypothetical protein [Acidobacteriota bacterium]